MKSATPALSTDLVRTVQNAWKEYADSKMERIDPNASSDWPAFKQKMTPEAVLSTLAIDEKFKMHFTALVGVFNIILLCYQITYTSDLG
jgi:hypothetical protein